MDEEEIIDGTESNKGYIYWEELPVHELYCLDLSANQGTMSYLFKKLSYLELSSSYCNVKAVPFLAVLESQKRSSIAVRCPDFLDYLTHSVSELP